MQNPLGKHQETRGDKKAKPHSTVGVCVISLDLQLGSECSARGWRHSQCQESAVPPTQSRRKVRPHTGLSRSNEFLKKRNRRSVARIERQPMCGDTCRRAAHCPKLAVTMKNRHSDSSAAPRNSQWTSDVFAATVPGRHLRQSLSCTRKEFPCGRRSRRLPSASQWRRR